MFKLCTNENYSHKHNEQCLFVCIRYGHKAKRLVLQCIKRNFKSRQGRTKKLSAQNLILTFLGLIFGRMMGVCVCEIDMTIVQYIYKDVWIQDVTYTPNFEKLR